MAVSSFYLVNDDPRAAVILLRAGLHEHVYLVAVLALGALEITVVGFQFRPLWAALRSGRVLDGDVEAADGDVALLVIAGILLRLGRLRQVVLRGCGGFVGGGVYALGVAHVYRFCVAILDGDGACPDVNGRGRSFVIVARRRRAGFAQLLGLNGLFQLFAQVLRLRLQRLRRLAVDLCHFGWRVVAVKFVVEVPDDALNVSNFVVAIETIYRLVGVLPIVGSLIDFRALPDGGVYKHARA